MFSENHSVSSHFARAHLDNTVRLGGDEEFILQRAGLTRELLAEPKARVSPQQLSIIVRANWAVANDEFMGLATDCVKVGVFSLFAESAIRFKTMAEVFEEAARFYNLINDGVRYQFNTDDQYASFSVELANPSLDIQGFLVEYLLLVWHRFPSWLAGQVLPLEEVWFELEEPQHSEEYRLMYPCPCRYEMPQNKLVFKNEYLSMPVIQLKEDLPQYLDEAPLQWFRKPAFYDAYTTQVIRLLEESSSLNDIGLETIAEKLHMTSRTLRRKLTAEGSSFQTLKDTIRRDQAINFLGDYRLTIAEVGRRIGFHEPTAFTRAFKQWTGLTPGIYRKGLHKTV